MTSSFPFLLDEYLTDDSYRASTTKNVVENWAVCLDKVLPIYLNFSCQHILKTIAADAQKKFGYF
jgi:hypothetical protein